MSFNISLSGLSAMQKALDVTSNNIAYHLGYVKQPYYSG